MRAELRRIGRLLACVRWDEVLVLQGTPLLGALFAMGTLTGEKCAQGVVMAMASISLVSHVFVLNDWAGARTDSRDPHREGDGFAGGPEAGVLCGALLGVSMTLGATLGLTPLLLVLALAVLSALYSAPPFAMKGLPLASSALHLAGGLLHFLLGYSLFREVDARALGLGSFFALTFAAGHLTHEARDFGGDRVNGIQTNAVRFGRARAFVAGFVLFTAGQALLAALVVSGAVHRAVGLGVALYPLHVWWTWRAWAEGLDFASIRGLQARYRALYAVIGVLMAGAR